MQKFYNNKRYGCELIWYRAWFMLFSGINNNFTPKASNSSFKLCFVKNDSLTPNTRESQGIEMVIKSDLDQIFIMSEKNGS